MKYMVSLFLLTITIISCDKPSSIESSDSSQDQLLGLASDSAIASEDGLQLDKINLPKGFKIGVYARVDNARSLALSPDGTLFIGNRGGDKVYAVQDTDGDMKADKKYVIASGLQMPNGVAYNDKALYIAEVSKLWKYENIEANLTNPPKPKSIYDDYPKDKHHGWKYIAFGPDGKLYIPVGAPCNICENKEKIYASITRMNADGSDQEVYASGVRNTVGFTWHPETNEMWFTDNGRDMFGDDKPPCELNRITSANQHFGYPYCHGGIYLDDEFGGDKNCDDYVSPAQNLGAHVAALGVKFITSSNFPASYKNKILIAEHGSWNRSEKSGYKVSMVAEVDGIGQSYESFADGWLDDASQESWGRPVDLVFAKDGSMLLSDDLTGTIYRIWYEE